MFLITIINAIYWLLLILFLARMVISFARIDPYDPTWGRLAQLVYQVTEPIMEPVRRLVPPQGGLDFSPLIILLGLAALRMLLFSLL
ncbi:MAG: YggT family protein [Anaerolineae bacterium]|nr:YggT family protein [Anaerolineae bacterium]